MGQPLESSTWNERATFAQGEFEVTGKAVQLDAFFTFLTASTKPTEELHDFCQLVFNVVAGTDAYDVRERLLEYSRIRADEEPSDAVSAILLSASRELEPFLGKEHADPLRSARRVLSVVELMRQGLTAVERFTVDMLSELSSIDGILMGITEDMPPDRHLDSCKAIMDGLDRHAREKAKLYA